MSCGHPPSTVVSQATSKGKFQTIFSSSQDPICVCPVRSPIIFFQSLPATMEKQRVKLFKSSKLPDSMIPENVTQRESFFISLGRRATSATSLSSLDCGCSYYYSSGSTLTSFCSIFVVTRFFILSNYKYLNYAVYDYCKYHKIIIKGPMREFLKKFTRSPTIEHFRIQFPITPIRTERVVTNLNALNSKSPALFVSFTGLADDPEVATSLHDAFKFITARKKIPMYAFLEDDINGLSYYAASAAQHIRANPFCKIGDLTAPTKSYLNIHGLLDLVGIKFQRIGQEVGSVWDPYLKPDQHQKQFTKRWLKVVSDQLKTSLAAHRSLQPSAVDSLSSSLLSPQKALQLRLIDSIGTLESYHEQHFPNNKLIQRHFTSQSRNPQFRYQEVQVLSQMTQWLAMPNVVLMSVENPITDCVRQFGQLVAERLSDRDGLDDLEVVAGKVLAKLRELGVEVGAKGV